GFALMCGFLWATDAAVPTKVAALLLGVGILTREPFGVVGAWMQAQTNNRPSVVFSLVALSAKAGLVALLFVAGTHTVPAFATAFAVEPMVLAVLLAAYYFSRMPHRRVSPDPGLARELVTGGA